jgi:hypothetical protein
MVTPGSKGVPAAVKAGLPWAGDNQAFSSGFNERRYYDWLGFMEPYWNTCIFVTVPDCPGDAEATLELYKYYEPDLAGWPLAFVAQDGQELLSLPDRFDCLFVGGWSGWKESAQSVDVIKIAQGLGKHIHVGRVNTARRFKAFQVLEGSADFTCDGTRQRYDGVKATLRAFDGMMNQPALISL